KNKHKAVKNGREEDSDAAVLECARQESRPAPTPVRLDARLGQNLRDVDGKLVRRRIHARVIAGAAVMAEVRKIKHIALFEIPSNLYGLKDRTVPLAVTAGVAYGQLAAGFLE